MIPTAVAREARENLLDYLRTTYALADSDFERALFKYLSGPEGLFRGPYLDVRLPFRQVKQGTVLPLEIAPPFLPWKHQMRAFERLHGQRGHQPQHTLVTTGTGSGKTECFLVPILGSLYQEVESRPQSFRRPGVRALILYPMNALVNDQLARLRLIFGDPEVTREFRALGADRSPRFGMYTGRTPYPGPRSAGRDTDRVAPLLQADAEEWRRLIRQVGFTAES